MKGYRIILIYLASVFAIVHWLCSCSPKVVTVPEIHTQYISRTDTVRKTDTLKYEKETIVRELTREDSLTLAQYGIRLKENERLILFLQRELQREKSQQSESRHDTIIKHDTIPYPVYVEKQQSWFHKASQDIPNIMAMLAVLAILGFIIYKCLKVERK